ncbi:MAG: conjugative transposon protein TraM [Prevotellaceae bacterium]|jgi:hypothetical protein|nr:conjugative transposon protein TraM [Prevotellaceae bacterium]
MSKQTEWLKKHIVLVMVVAVVALLFVLVLYLRGRVRNFRARQAATTIVKEPTITPNQPTREYEVDNSNAAAIFGMTSDTGAGITEALPPPTAAPVAIAPSEATPAPAPKAATKPAATQAKAKVKAPAAARTAKADSGAASGSDGALAAMERREKAAAEKARAETNERVRTEREARLAAEAKAAALEEQMRKPKFNFTVVQERNDFGTVNLPDKNSKVTQDKELLYTAKIYGTQRVKSGDPVTLRNTEIIPYGKNKMPAGSIIYGIAQQSGNRMQIHLSNVMTREGKFPITGLSICDFDMVKGIYLKEYEEVAQDKAGESVVEEVGSVLPNQLVGTVAKETSRQLQKTISKQQKITITLEDSYEVYIAVPTK